MAVADSLAGITVVSIEQAVAAPFCTARLADAGARVIKVERPEGDFARRYDRTVLGQASYFVWLNRGKESIALDLKRPDDATCLERMLAAADVFVQNLAPGAIEKLGFAPALLRQRHPRLIVCSISGYGAGAWSERKAYDLLVQAECGLSSTTGTHASPARVGISVADLTCGLNAWGAILEALVVRARSGRGATIETSLFGGMADMMTVPLLQFEGSGQLPPRIGLHHASIAPYGAYVCSDGAQILFAIQNEREWQRFCTEVIGRGDLAGDERFASNGQRVAHRSALDLLIQTTLQNLTGSQFTAKLELADIAWGLVRDVAGLAGHPALERVAVQCGVNSVMMPVNPIRVDGQRRRAGAVPTLDAQGPALRREFGDGTPR